MLGLLFQLKKWVRPFLTENKSNLVQRFDKKNELTGGHWP